MKNFIVFTQILLMVPVVIGCRSDNTHKISTITIERIDPIALPQSLDGSDVHWRLVADPPPSQDLVVIIVSEPQSDDWSDYARSNWKRTVGDRKVPPFYVVIEKSNRHSQTFVTSKQISLDLSDIKEFLTEETPTAFYEMKPFYINPLPRVSIVGKGMSIDTDMLSRSLPARTHGGHIIPEGHKFAPYQIGESIGIDKFGYVITK